MGKKRWHEGYLSDFIIGVIVIVIAVVLGSASGAGKDGAVDDEAAVLDVITRHAALHETGDLAAIERLWAHNAEATMAEGGKFNYGWENFRNHHLCPEIETMKNVKFPIEDVTVHVTGNLACATYSYHVSGEYKGRAFDSAGVATMFLEKRGGAWLIVREHTSAERRSVVAKSEQK